MTSSKQHHKQTAHEQALAIGGGCGHRRPYPLHQCGAHRLGRPARSRGRLEPQVGRGAVLAPRRANRLVILHEDEPGDTKMGRCAAGGPLRLGDKTYPRGIGVNSHSTLRVTLDRPARKLLAVIGLDRNVDNTQASCRFHVRVGTRTCLPPSPAGQCRRRGHRCAAERREGVRPDRGRRRR